MDIQIILNELKKDGWWLDKDFIKSNINILQAISDKTIELQIQKDGSIFPKNCINNYDDINDCANLKTCQKCS